MAAAFVYSLFRSLFSAHAGALRRLFVALAVIAIVATPTRANATHQWWPENTTPPELVHAWTDGYGEWWRFGQQFNWSTHNMEGFQQRNEYFQFEIRRYAEFWDFYHCGVSNFYWTNLPSPYLEFSEENDPPWCWADKGGDEEFELKVMDKNLQANFWYFAHGYFTWDLDGGDGTGWKRVDIESEYCLSGFPFGCYYVTQWAGSVCRTGC